MLHSLLTDIVRRRLWPIPLLALAVAIGAPLLFLKPAPAGAPAVAAAIPAPAPASRLPARAERLLASTDAGPRTSGSARGAKHDPFAPPPVSHATAKTAQPAGSATSSHSGASSSAAKSGSSAAPATATTPAAPVPVVITNADGSVPKSAPVPAPPISGDGTPALTASTAAVDVRFGEKLGTPLRRDIPRLQSFVAGGEIVAIFVKYSPKRDKAVFAISPSTLVTGDVACRRKAGLCRYVDVPAGKGVRLTWRAAGGTVMSRRLDIVRIGSATRAPGAANVARTGTSSTVAKCLLGKVLALGLQQQVAVNDCGE